MKINNDTAVKRLEGVPENYRVFIYNAEIIIEFLNSTFMPLPYFLKPGAEIFVGDPLKADMLREPPEGIDWRLEAEKLYHYYLLFRENRDYTSKIESEFQFKVILSRMIPSKNRWGFLKKRFSRDQTIFFYPLFLRTLATREDRERFPIVKTDVTQGVVETQLEDFQGEENDLVGQQPPIGQPFKAALPEIDEVPFDGEADAERAQAGDPDTPPDMPLPDY